jgi:hypothetical protein
MNRRRVLWLGGAAVLAPLAPAREEIVEGSALVRRAEDGLAELLRRRGLKA